MNPRFPEIVIGALAATAFWLVVALFSSGLAAFKDFAGPAATAFAAVAAGWVAYQLGQSQIAVAKTQAAIAERKWKTSNEKIVLGLFDRRFSIFEEVRSIIGEIVRSGIASNELQFRYQKAIDRVPYFFGEEVQEYLERIRLHIIDLSLANSMMENLADPDRSKWVEKRSTEFLAITNFYKDSAPLFGPYMKAHQKA